MLGYAEELFLGTIRVHDDAALDIARGACDIGQPVAEEPARTRFGHGHHPPAPEEEPPHHRLEQIVVLPVAVRAESGAHLGFHGLEGDRRESSRGATGEEPDVHVGPHGRAGDGDVAFLPEPLAQPVLGIGRGKPRGQEHPQDLFVTARQTGQRLQHLIRQLGEVGSVQGKHHEQAVPSRERPAVRALGRRGKKLGTARQEGEPIETPRHGEAALGEGGLDQGEAPLVEHEPRAGEAADHARHQLAL